MRKLRLHERLVYALIPTLCVVMCIPTFVHAQSTTTRLSLRPHCIPNEGVKDEISRFGGVPDIPILITTRSGKERCSSFRIHDPLLRETPMLKKGDILDMDLVIKKAQRDIPVHRVRSWIVYDPILLEGVSIEINPEFTEQFPGEQDFSPEEGYIKIGVGALKGIKERETIVARIKMRVLDTPIPSTVMSFYDLRNGPDGHTAVISGKAQDETNILLAEQESLLVQLDSLLQDALAPLDEGESDMPEDDNGDPAPIANERFSFPEDGDYGEQDSLTDDMQEDDIFTPPPPAPESDAPKPPVSNTPFSLLQVQNLAVTSQDSLAYLAWDPLASAELIGYNIYYGAQPGTYIHKRSVDASTVNTTIRDLPIGTRYYFAVRGVNTLQEESAFSREVAVVISKPETSTSPLSADTLRAQPQTPKLDSGRIVPGETGIPSTIALLLLVSASIGTILACRRQLIASRA
jgi:hypothetical protein